MEKITQSQVKTRSMSKQDSTTTIDNVTQRLQRVSTEENLDHLQKDEEINTSKKHKLSSAGIDAGMTSKKLRHGQMSHEQLMKTTRAVIEKLLQKETTSTPTSRQSRKSKRKSRSNKSPIACTFSEAGENKDILLDQKNPSNDDVPPIKEVEHVKLDFSGSFESDSCFFPGDIEADGFETDHSTKVGSDLTQDNTKEQVDKKIVSEVAETLRNIGDKLDNEVKQEVKKAAIKIVKKKAYKTYRDALQSLLDMSQPADQLCGKERYQVALVWLLTEKTITEAKVATASNNEVNGIVENAVYFISENFPFWLNPWI